MSSARTPRHSAAAALPAPPRAPAPRPHTHTHTRARARGRSPCRSRPSGAECSAPGLLFQPGQAMSTSQPRTSRPKPCQSGLIALGSGFNYREVKRGWCSSWSSVPPVSRSSLPSALAGTGTVWFFLLSLRPKLPRACFV